MESCKTKNHQICCFGQKLRIHKHLRHWTSNDIQCCNDVLSLSLPSISFCFMEQLSYKLTISLVNSILSSKLFLHSLLFKCSLHLIFIFNGLPSHLFLFGHRILVSLSAHLSHLFFLPQSFLISLKLKLYLVFGTSLCHFCFILSCLSLFFLFNLSLLNLEFFSIFS